MGNGTEGIPQFPTHVQVQTTSACGAACTICPHPVESPNWSNGLMTDDLFDRIVAQLAARDVRYVSPYLMADPLSDKKIFQRIHSLHTALPAAHIEVSTTGKYLTPRLADRLLDAPLSELRISKPRHHGPGVRPHDAGRRFRQGDGEHPGVHRALV